MAFERLIRFVGDDNQIHYGNAPGIIKDRSIEGSKVSLVDGDLDKGFTATTNTATVKQLLAPIPHVPIFICVGLNYQQHAKEANANIARDPVLFNKPPDALAGPFEDIPIHKEAQPELDYEGEFSVVIGRDGKDIPEAQALDYVLGYTCGNDVSARNFQLPATVSGGQFGYAKSFDKFGPIGPCIVSTSVIKDPQALSYVTKVNGEVRQKTPTSDMIWTIKQLIAHASKGTTLRKGTVIMTGTPSGVGIFMEPKGYLKSGDIVEMEADEIGVLQNRMVF